MREKIPVIIPAYNEAANMPRLLEALHSQTIDVDPIVIDNNSTDNTAEVAKYYDATVLGQPEKGQLQAIIMGLEYALAVQDGQPLQKLVLLTDGDTQPRPTWAESMLANAEKTSTPTLFSGKVDFFYPQTPVGQMLRIARLGHIATRRKIRDVREQQPIVHGPNIGFANMTHTLLNNIIDLPNYGLGNDQAMASTFLDYGADVELITDSEAVVKINGDRYSTLKDFYDFIFKSQEAVYTQEGSNFEAQKVYHIPN